jgi:hypothetical protein
MTVGAAALVLGAALIAIAPMYVTTGIYKQEFQNIGSGTSAYNSTTMVKALTDVSNQALEIALAGAVIAAAGGGTLAYGVTPRTSEPKVPKPEDTMSSSS